MKTTVLISMLIYFFSLNNLFSQTSSLKFSQTFTCRTSNNINLNIDNPNVEIKSIKGSIIVVEASIEITSTNYRLLKFLQESGRYNIESVKTEDGKQITLTDRKKKDEIKIKGKTIIEYVNYTIFIPEGQEFQNMGIIASR